MFDFLYIAIRSPKRGVTEIYPKFIVGESEDLMIRGGDFYAVYDETSGLWSTSELDAIRIIDKEIDAFANEKKDILEGDVRVKHLWDAESGMIDVWHKYCQKQMRDSFHPLDEKLIFSDTEVKKTDYASKRLPYPLREGKTDAYDEMMRVLYSPAEREKIEWAIGSIVCGESKRIQKFLVLYGAAGTGKSTILNLISQLFAGYFCVFDAKALGSSSNAFALEAFRSNPLVAIQHDGDLSHIEDNTRLNSLVSHEMMTVNEKFRSTYANRFNCFLFMGTNKPVKITDAKSGLIRRLIDVSPTGDKLKSSDYNRVMRSLPFELGAIAYRCKKIFEEDPSRYDTYIPLTMLGASNDFYNFVADAYAVFKENDGTTLRAAWELYRVYCDDAKVPYPLSKRIFKEELKNYFRDYAERETTADGTRVRSWYSGFLTEKLDGFDDMDIPEEKEEFIIPDWLKMEERESVFDIFCGDSKAQYATEEGIPGKKWENVTSVLFDLDTSLLHYVKPPEAHIVIDLDIPDENGNKCLRKNLEAASAFPPTYAELSKSGEGIHLHYIYTGDPMALSPIVSDHVEAKIFTGGLSLRRKLTKCNGLDISVIDGGLPLKGRKKVIDFEGIKNEKGLRTLIGRNLRKEIHPGTKPSIDFIKKILDEAYEAGYEYDVSDLKGDIIIFASHSTHHPEDCLKLVGQMKFRSASKKENVDDSAGPLIFFDVEVFPNLFLVNWKYEDSDTVVRMINPSSNEIEALIWDGKVKRRLVGFNNRRYDNHMLYARLIGETNEQLYLRSQRIVAKHRDAFFSEAYNLSYTDILDFSSEKKSLKKFEIELGIHHKELGLPWDKPVPESDWVRVAEYCDNDVIATEAVFKARKADFKARQILADITGMTVNDTTNSITARLFFGSERNPQHAFNYRFMGDMNDICDSFVITDDLTLFNDIDKEFTRFNKDGKPIFPGYTYEAGVSKYRGEVVGEGGYVYAEPGIYRDVALLDIASMHPSSIVAEDLFGPYTAAFDELRQARIAIKHRDFDKARTLFGGKLAKYLTSEDDADDLARSLKIPINASYGLTDAGFENPFRDVRNKDNIVAKRGALFMVNLKHEVQKRGFTVTHIKTDSIKIPNATPEIISFVQDYGKMYGYVFEHEATYDRICLVNDAVYIASYASLERVEALYGKEYVHAEKDICKGNKKHPGEWTATGKQFAVPYVFKTLFSREPIVFDDLCEVKQVTSALYLDMNEGLPENEHNYIFVGRVGQFCPIREGKGGGLLLREADGKFYAAVGSKGWRWMESENVRLLEKEDDIDISYYDELAEKAKETIGKFGNFEEFIFQED